MLPLVCSVRGCGRTLERRDKALVCSRGHAVDVAKSGYVNLLQPQDRRSREPGDPRRAIEARRRLVEKGFDDWLFAEALAELDSIGREIGRPVETVLDIGCGEGFLLGSLESARGIEAHGVDISAVAVDLAAKKYPRPTWVVANADRFLPWPELSFDLVTSFTSRRSGREIARVLAPGGRFLAALPGADDLVELRAALFGGASSRDRTDRAVEALRPRFELARRRAIRRRAWLDAETVRDVLAATYRGARKSQAERARELGAMEVTLSRELLLFRSAIGDRRSAIGSRKT